MAPASGARGIRDAQKSATCSATETGTTRTVVGNEWGFDLQLGPEQGVSEWMGNAWS